MSIRAKFVTIAVAAGLVAGGVARADDEAKKKAESPFPYACDVEHKDAIRFLYLMADGVLTLNSLPKEQRDTAALKIRAAARTLEQSHPAALHSPETKSALTEAAEVLDALPNKSPLLTQKVAAATDSVSKIDEGVPYLKQRSTVDLAIRDTADALKLANQESRAQGQPSTVAVVVARPAPPPPIPTVLEKRKVYLDRWAFDQAGPQPNLNRICEGHPAKGVKVKRNGGDIILALLTIGMYTPAEATVTCEVPRTNM
jgi:hypothetical protein